MHSADTTPSQDHDVPMLSLEDTTDGGWPVYLGMLSRKRQWQTTFLACRVSSERCVWFRRKKYTVDLHFCLGTGLLETKMILLFCVSIEFLD